MSPLLPIAGTAALSLAGEAVHAIGNGLSFATELLRQDNDVARMAAPPPIELPRSPAQSKFEQVLREFVAKLRQRLESAGIDLSGPLVLESDGLGGIQVGSDTTDESAIEQALAEDGQLVAEFNLLADEQKSLRGSIDRLRDFGLVIAEEEAEVIWR